MDAQPQVAPPDLVLAGRAAALPASCLAALVLLYVAVRWTTPVDPAGNNKTTGTTRGGAATKITKKPEAGTGGRTTAAARPPVVSRWRTGGLAVLSGLRSHGYRR